jgi:hypothetical protein
MEFDALTGWIITGPGRDITQITLLWFKGIAAVSSPRSKFGAYVLGSCSVSVGIESRILLND